MKVLFISSALLLTHLCLAQDYKILEGTWKVEGKETYESWNWQEDELLGESYKIKDGQKHITETLVIKEIDDEVVYSATVPNQNEGATIPFKLNAVIDNKLQFENPTHDFPTKIIYEPLSTNRMLVQVLGNDDKGFSYYLEKVDGN